MASGKSHLLRAVGEALREQGARFGWLDAGVHQPPVFDEGWAAVLLDDVQLYTAEQQHAAFSWFVQAQALQRGVVAAGSLPPSDLALREDLRTRLGWGHVFQLLVLSEAERRAEQAAVAQRAAQEDAATAQRAAQQAADAAVRDGGMRARTGRAGADSV
jgi:DnaA family protein